MFTGTEHALLVRLVTQEIERVREAAVLDARRHYQGFAGDFADLQSHAIGVPPKRQVELDALDALVAKLNEPRRRAAAPLVIDRERFLARDPDPRVPPIELEPGCATRSTFPVDMRAAGAAAGVYADARAHATARAHELEAARGAERAAVLVRAEDARRDALSTVTVTCDCLECRQPVRAAVGGVVACGFANPAINGGKPCGALIIVCPVCLLPDRLSPFTAWTPGMKVECVNGHTWTPPNWK